MVRGHAVHSCINGMENRCRCVSQSCIRAQKCEAALASKSAAFSAAVLQGFNFPVHGPSIDQFCGLWYLEMFVYDKDNVPNMVKGALRTCITGETSVSKVLDIQQVQE